jgi:hypothetical protein
MAKEEGMLQKEAKLMKLEALIADRERIPVCEFPIPVKELCHRYEQLYTGAINDVLREKCLLCQNLPPTSCRSATKCISAESPSPSRARPTS